jgi:hypothetical protein
VIPPRFDRLFWTGAAIGVVITLLLAATIAWLLTHL